MPSKPEWERCDDHSYWWVAGEPSHIIFLMNPLEGRLFWFEKKEDSTNWRGGQLMLRRSKFTHQDTLRNVFAPGLTQAQWDQIAPYLEAYYSVRRGPQSWEGNATAYKYSLKKEPTSEQANFYLDNLIDRPDELENFLRSFWAIMESVGVKIGKRDLEWFWEAPPESWERLKWEMAMGGDRTLSGVPLECAVAFAGVTSEKF